MCKAQKYIPNHSPKLLLPVHGIDKFKILFWQFLDFNNNIVLNVSIKGKSYNLYVLSKIVLT